MSIRTVYEVRELLKVGALADVCTVERFDELEQSQAKAAYGRAVGRAMSFVGADRTFYSHGGAEITGVVGRAAVELISYKTSDGRCWDHKVVGEDTDEVCRRVLEVEKQQGAA